MIPGIRDVGRTSPWWIKAYILKVVQSMIFMQKLHYNNGSPHTTKPGYNLHKYQLEWNKFPSQASQ